MKQAIVVRKDIKMGKGKLAAQCCHASLGSYKRTDRDIVGEWEDDGCAKIVLKVQTLDELFVLKETAGRLGISNFLVTDAGRTQLPTSTITCLGIGPDTDENIDKVIKDLKLL